MKQPDPMLFDLQNLIVKLTSINRHHYITDKNEHENDIEHSFAVVVLCWYIYDAVQPPLDLSVILKCALSHDFVEAYAGDVSAFAPTQERVQKVENEKIALERLSDDYYGFKNLVASMQSYESKSNEESLFVWTVDKMQALILGSLDEWRPYIEDCITFEDFSNKYSELLKRSSPYCRELFESLITYSKSTYYEQPGVSPTL